MPARTRQTGANEHTEHKDCNTPTGPKSLKVLVLTQGIVVTGSGRLSNGYYVGTLTYKIEDSYGYSTKDHFYGFGDALRYLQTVCGNPPQKGGAHWFRDSVTVSVNFKLPR
jgi:hypothetical protein